MRGATRADTVTAVDVRAHPQIELESHVARRVLRFELERLCAGVRHDMIAGWLGVSRPSASAALACKNLFSKPALEVILTRLDRLEQFPHLAALLQAARRRPARGVPVGRTARRDDVLAVGLEAFAHSITVFDPWTVPPHLQTEAYAAALDSIDMSPSSTGREQRQALLQDSNAPAFRWVTVEHALTRIVGSEVVMRDQFRHLLDLAARPNFTVQIIPADTDPGATGASFQLIDGPPPVVAEFGRLAVHYAHSPDEVAHFAALLDDLGQRALTPDASATLIRLLLERNGR